MKLKLRPRRIVNLAYSYFISLPIEWVRSQNLSKKDALQPTILENGDLLLKPLHTEDCDETTSSTA